MSTQVIGAGTESLLGMPVTVSGALPVQPSDAERIRRRVRHGLADVLAYLGEPVGPTPEAATHALIVEGRIFASAEYIRALRRAAQRDGAEPETEMSVSDRTKSAPEPSSPSARGRSVSDRPDGLEGVQ